MNMNKTAMCFGIAALVLVANVPAQAGGYRGGHGGGHYSGGHYGGGHFGGGHYGGHYYGGHGGHLAAGLLLGGLIGWAASDHYYVDRRYGYGYPYRHAHYASSPAYYYERDSGADKAAACTMTREYTSKVEIDGVQREAYGTRCRKADGSWSYGPLSLVPVTP